MISNSRLNLSLSNPDKAVTNTRAPLLYFLIKKSPLFFFFYGLYTRKYSGVLNVTLLMLNKKSEVFSSKVLITANEERTIPSVPPLEDGMCANVSAECGSLCSL